MDLLRTGCICWASKTASLPWSISHIKALQFRKISLIGEILQDISLSNSTDIALMQTFMRVERIEGKIKPWLLFRFFKKILYWNFNNSFSRVCKIFTESFLNFILLSYIENHTWHALRSLRPKAIIR